MKIKKSIILSSVIGVGIIIASGFTVVNSNGIAYYTGSPSDGSSCSSCHSGGTTTTTASITASPAWGGSGNNLTYTPGTTYTITIVEAGYSEYGFDIEIMNTNSASGTTDAGTMSVLNSTYSKLNGTGPTNITHKTPIPVATHITLKWVAPASGTAYLYAAINGVNGNGTTSGDKEVTKAFILTPAAASPVAAFTESSSTVCAGQSITLTDNSTNTPTSWAWTMTGGSPATSTSQNPSVSYSTAGTYTVSLVATNAGGSSSPLSKVVTVNALPNVASTSTTVCNGSSATIMASGATTYSWNIGGTSATLNITPSATTTYTVTGTTSGCSKTATGVVTVNPLPTVTAPSQTICIGHTATLTASGATTYTWSNGDVGASCVVTPTANTTWTVTGTTAGCSKTATSVVTVSVCTTGITTNYNPAANLVNLYPNPANEFLNVDLGLLTGTTTVQLYDVSGRLVIEKHKDGTDMQINLIDVSKGTYFAKVLNNKTIIAVKMIIVSK